MKKMAICLIILMLAACTKSNPIEPFRTDDTSWQPQIHTAITGYNRFYIADTTFYNVLTGTIHPEFDNLDARWYERNTAYLCAELSKSNSIVRIDTFYNYLNGTQFFPMDFISDAILDAAVPYSVKMVAEYRNGTRRESNAVEILAEPVPGTVLHVEPLRDLFDENIYDFFGAMTIWDGDLYLIKGSSLYRYNIDMQTIEKLNEGISYYNESVYNFAISGEFVYHVIYDVDGIKEIFRSPFNTNENFEFYQFSATLEENNYYRFRLTGSDGEHLYFYEINDDSLAFHRLNIDTKILQTRNIRNIIFEGLGNGTLNSTGFEVLSDGQNFWLLNSARNLNDYNRLYTIDIDNEVLINPKVVPVYNWAYPVFDGEYFWVFDYSSGERIDEKLVRFSPGAG